MAREGALWIGGLEPYMSEAFLSEALAQSGLSEGVVSIKVMTNRFTGEPAGYGFINFESDEKAIFAMHRLGGKVIPNSDPVVRYKLNHNSTRLRPGQNDTSIWVGDLEPHVDDLVLFEFFSQRYSSVRCAKVVLDEHGNSKGYGFVRFGLENEQQHALAHMSGDLGLGSKPIKVALANQRNRRPRVPQGMQHFDQQAFMMPGHQHMGWMNNPHEQQQWQSAPPAYQHFYQQQQQQQQQHQMAQYAAWSASWGQQQQQP